MQKEIYLLVISILVISLACNKGLNDINKNENQNKTLDKSLDFYLLENFETLDQSLEILEYSAIISSEKFISYEDIVSYDNTNHTFKVKQAIIDKLSKTSDYHKKAFAVTIDGEIIYTGYFWYMYSSSICNWLTIEPLSSLETKRLRVDLGYPGDSFGDVSNDNRNNTRIINLLKKDNKLINQ